MCLHRSGQPDCQPDCWACACRRLAGSRRAAISALGRAWVRSEAGCSDACRNLHGSWGRHADVPKGARARAGVGGRRARRGAGAALAGRHVEVQVDGGGAAAADARLGAACVAAGAPRLVHWSCLDPQLRAWRCPLACLPVSAKRQLLRGAGWRQQLRATAARAHCRWATRGAVVPKLQLPHARRHRRHLLHLQLQRLRLWRVVRLLTLQRLNPLLILLHPEPLQLALMLLPAHRYRQQPRCGGAEAGCCARLGPTPGRRSPTA